MTDTPGGGEPVPSDPWAGAGSDPSSPVDVLPPIRNLWTWWAWSMVAIVLLLIGVGIGVDILRASILLDILSFWPVLVAVAIAAAVAWLRRNQWSGRTGSVVALAALTALMVVVALHLFGWSALPSSVAVEGPPFDGGDAELAIVASQGSVIIDTAPLDRALDAAMIPRGGDLTAPRLTGADSSPPELGLVARGDPGFHRAQGWLVTLAETGRWQLSVEALRVDADLRGVIVRDVSLSGGGMVIVDRVAPGARISLGGGEYELDVPSGIGIGVEGSASVPADWTTTSDGATSPAGSGGFVVVVGEAASVTITQR